MRYGYIDLEDTYIKTSSTLDSELTAEELAARTRDALQAIRSTISEEIVRYPMPITACDVQYNHLLQARRQARAEMTHLQRMVEQGPLSIDTLRTFVHASETLDTREKAALLNLQFPTR